MSYQEKGIMSEQESGELEQQLERLKSGIKEITHDINSPLGVLRMAAYFIETGEYDTEKKLHYVEVMNQSLDKIETCLQRLKALREHPQSTEIG